MQCITMEKHSNQHSNQLTLHDETKKRAHDSQIIRAKENLKSSHGGSSYRCWFLTFNPLKYDPLPFSRCKPRLHLYVQTTFIPNYISNIIIINTPACFWGTNTEAYTTTCACKCWLQQTFHLEHRCQWWWPRCCSLPRANWWWKCSCLC